MKSQHPQRKINIATVIPDNLSLISHDITQPPLRYHIEPKAIR
jgi:hypothetical protein